VSLLEPPVSTWFVSHFVSHFSAVKKLRGTAKLAAGGFLVAVGYQCAIELMSGPMETKLRCEPHRRPAAESRWRLDVRGEFEFDSFREMN